MVRAVAPAVVLLLTATWIGRASGAALPVPRGTERAASLSVGGGLGYLALRDNLGTDGQLAAGVHLRLAAGLLPDWMAYLELAATSAHRGGGRFQQQALLLGIQRFFLGRLYLRAGAGVARVVESGDLDQSVGPAWALGGALGAEVLRDLHVAAGLEIGAVRGLYARESWDMACLCAVLSLF